MSMGHECNAGPFDHCCRCEPGECEDCRPKPPPPSEWVAIKKVVMHNGKPWVPAYIEYEPDGAAPEWQKTDMPTLLTARWSASFSNAVEKKEVK